MEENKNSLTYDNFRDLIHKLSENYSFINFVEGKKNRDVNEPLVIMRHDIDMDLISAQNIALIEEDCGVLANFFFMVRCSLYNVFSHDNSQRIKRILSAGHHFGLHFDCAIYKDISEDNLEYYIAKECTLLEEFYELPIEAISFHRPGGIALSGLSFEKWPNSYEQIFINKFNYFSDSKGIWKNGNPLESEAYLKKEKMHILIHPVWWTSHPATPYEKLVNLIKTNKHLSEQYISENCTVWNEGKTRENLSKR